MFLLNILKKFMNEYHLINAQKSKESFLKEFTKSEARKKKSVNREAGFCHEQSFQINTVGDKTARPKSC